MPSDNVETEIFFAPEYSFKHVPDVLPLLEACKEQGYHPAYAPDVVRILQEGRDDLSFLTLSVAIAGNWRGKGTEESAEVLYVHVPHYLSGLENIRRAIDETSPRTKFSSPFPQAEFDTLRDRVDGTTIFSVKLLSPGYPASMPIEQLLEHPHFIPALGVEEPCAREFLELIERKYNRSDGHVRFSPPHKHSPGQPLASFVCFDGNLLHEKNYSIHANTILTGGSWGFFSVLGVREKQ